MVGQYGAMPLSADFLKQALTTGLAPPGLYPGAMLADVQQQAVFQNPVIQQQLFDQQAAQAALQQRAAAFQTAAVQQKPIGESLFLPSNNTFAAFAQGQRRIAAQDSNGISQKADQLQQL